MNLQKWTQKIMSFDNARGLYPHRLYKNYSYTDSVRANMVETRSSWVVERIFALQERESVLQNNEVQLWVLKIFPDSSILLACTDDKGAVVYFEHRDPAEYPKENLAFILERGVLSLRS